MKECWPRFEATPRKLRYTETLTDYAIPPEIRALEHRISRRRLHLALCDPNRHHGLDAMLAKRWITRTGRSGHSRRPRRPLPAGGFGREHGGSVFPQAGLPEPTGRGFCWHRHPPQYQHRHLGKLLFLSPVCGGRSAPRQSICRCSPAWPTRHVASGEALVLPRCCLAY